MSEVKIQNTVEKWTAVFFSREVRDKVPLVAVAAINERSNGSHCLHHHSQEIGAMLLRLPVWGYMETVEISLTVLLCLLGGAGPLQSCM